MFAGKLRLSRSVQPTFEVGRLAVEGGFDSSVTESAMMAAAEWGVVVFVPLEVKKGSAEPLL
jgi:hypothetical protein